MIRIVKRKSEVYHNDFPVYLVYFDTVRQGKNIKCKLIIKQQSNFVRLQVFAPSQFFFSRYDIERLFYNGLFKVYNCLELQTVLVKQNYWQFILFVK